MLTADGLTAVFEPRRIALVGASDRPGSVGSLLWANLADFPGDVLPVCQAATVGGEVAYPDLREVPGDVDLAVIATPAATVPHVLRTAAAKGIRAAVVLSAGFAETGPEGARLQQEALAAARSGGVRLVGPNCFGVQNAALPLNASIAAGTPAGGGGVSIVTQSGSYGMAVHTLGQEEALRVAKVYAAGNKADVSDAEMLGYLRADPHTTVICLLLESVTGARQFFAEACLATAAKPVVAVIGGRSRAGRRAALSHTAALATDDAVRDAALRQAGVVRVRTGLQALDAARALDGQPFPRGRRIAVVTNSGGTGVELTDLLADEGLEIPELSPGLQARLRELLPGYASARNPVDITPVWSLFTSLYPAALDMLARSGEIDVVVPVLIQRAASKEVAEAVREAVARLNADDVGVPVYACWVAPRAAQPHADLLQRAGVPCFAWPERTARAVGAAVRAGMRIGHGTTWPPARPSALSRRGGMPSPKGDRLPAGPAAEPALPRPAANGLLGDEAARNLLVAAGVPVIETAVCKTPAEAATAADGLGYPAVVKVAHPDLTHKSDVGGVRLGLSSADEVAKAASELLTLAGGAAVLVQHQLAGTELVVGGIRDHEFGPVVMAGMGGIGVEAQRDVALAVAPVDQAQATTMLRSLRAAAVLGGMRGVPPVNVASVSALIEAVSYLITDFPQICELDLNPVLASADGCVAVDWRVRLG
ncbi:MAG TPA: acetate--CoA ligase family protein [Streptosporangiaceae bacterium]|nr:acetate--CoA ligase family protein [Streptosporangiaceae bacterium]